jgi:uncharacterized protein
LDIVRLLLDHHGVDVNIRGEDGWTPLHVASYLNYFDIVQALLDRGADVHMRSDQGRTPFQEAQRRGRREIMRLLSEYSGRRI